MLAKPTVVIISIHVNGIIIIPKFIQSMYVNYFSITQEKIKAVILN